MLLSFTTEAAEIGVGGQSRRTRLASAAKAQSPATALVKATFGPPLPNDSYRAVAGVVGPSVSSSPSNAASAVRAILRHIGSACSSYLRPYGDRPDDQNLQRISRTSLKHTPIECAATIARHRPLWNRTVRLRRRYTMAKNSDIGRCRNCGCEVEDNTSRCPECANRNREDCDLSYQMK